MKYKSVYLLIILLIGLLLLTSCQPITAPPTVATAPTTSSLDNAIATQIDVQIETLMSEFNVPGIAFGVVKDGELIYTKGYGVTELGSNKPVTPKSVFLLSSIAKTVTSTAIMQLVEQGKIDLDAFVIDYLPYFKLADDRYSALTIRHLLTHTSGLPEYDYGEVGKDPQHDEGALERYVRSMQDMTLLHAPGVQFEYSGIGYDILGDVVAKVTGQSFETYVAEQVLQPLGMEHSTFLLDEVDPALLMSAHIPNAEGETAINNVFPYDRIHGPDSNLYSTVEDMARYATAHLNQGELDGVRILAAADYEQMWTVYNQTPFPPPDDHYGMGWMLSDYKGHALAGHGGLDVGVNSFLALFPEKSMAVILLTNYSSIASADPAEWIMPAFFVRESILDLLLNEAEK